MPWYLLIGVGFLIGLALSNATIRHHALTLIIWISKASAWIFSGIIWACEWLQDRFDDVDVSTYRSTQSQIHHKPEQQRQPQPKEPEPIKEPIFDFAKASSDDTYASTYIKNHPEQVRVIRRSKE